MEKHCEIERRFGKEGNGEPCRQEALKSFIYHSGKRAYEVAFSLSGNGEDAKELVQETLYRVARAWKQYDGSRPMEPWFFGILRNAFLDSRRSFAWRYGVSLESRAAETDGIRYSDTLVDNEDSPLSRLERAENVEVVRRALAGLGAKHRVILSLCDGEGRKYDDVARRLGISVGTVRSRMSRARRALKTRISNRMTLFH